jgi:hypothetical protein
VEVPEQATVTVEVAEAAAKPERKAPRRPQAPAIPQDILRLLRMTDGQERRRQMMAHRGPAALDSSRRIAHESNLLMVYLCSQDGETVLLGNCLKFLAWSGTELWSVMRWAMRAGYVYQARGRKIWVFTSCPTSWGWPK